MATMTRRLQTVLLLIAMLAGVSATALGQVTLTELGAANAARNDMMSNSAGNAAAAAPPASRQGAGAAAVQTVNYGMKYTLSYALTGLLLALGMYLVCRPSNRNAVE
jgi:hypothetical protein